MKLSKHDFLNIRKSNIEKLETIDLLEHANFIKKASSGSYIYLHLMQKIINKINCMIRQKMDQECLEIGLTQLQSAKLWKETRRYETYGDEMFHFKDRKNNDMVLAGTNEELITDTIGRSLTSYKDLNITYYCISNKFRDELRCYNGLERCKEFIMLDAYSFHDTLQNLQDQYQKIRAIFISIFDELRLKYEIKKSDNGEIGGSISEEFIVNGIEIAHIFQLDDKYTKSLEVTHVDKNNNNCYTLMGCYGIGISRLIQVIADNFRQDNFLNWGKYSSYDVAILIADTRDTDQVNFATILYETLKKKCDVYLDDRDIRLGAKLHQVDTIGTCYKIIVGKNAKDQIFEIKQNNNWIKTSNYETIFN